MNAARAPMPMGALFGAGAACSSIGRGSLLLLWSLLLALTFVMFVTVVTLVTLDTFAFVALMLVCTVDVCCGSATVSTVCVSIGVCVLKDPSAWAAGWASTQLSCAI